MRTDRNSSFRRHLAIAGVPLALAVTHWQPAFAACRPFDPSQGPFVTTFSWSATASSPPTVVVTQAATSLTVKSSSCSQPLVVQLAEGTTLRYQFVGTEKHLLYYVSTPASPGQAQVSLSVVNYRACVNGVVVRKELLAGLSRDTSTPEIHYSQGSAAVLLAWLPDTSTPQVARVGLFRGDNGRSLWSGAPSFFAPSSQLTARVQGREIEVFGVPGAPLVIPFPTGTSEILPPKRAVFEALINQTSKTTRVLRNVGGDCLEVGTILAPAPFRIVTTRPALPAVLGTEEEVEIDIEFAPAAPVHCPRHSGEAVTRELAIALEPAIGDQTLRLEGTTRLPALSCAAKPCGPGPGCCFANGDLGHTKTFDLELAQTGKQSLQIDGLAIQNDPTGVFSFAPSVPSLPLVLTPSSVQKLPIRFAPPPGFRDYSAQVRLENTTLCPATPIAATCQFFASSSDGQGRMEVATNAIEFGSVEVGSCVSKSIRVDNIGGTCGNLRATIDDLSSGSPDAQHWSRLPIGESKSIPGGSFHGFEANFEPRTTGGPFEVRLRVQGSDPENPTEDVVLRGQGIESGIGTRLADIARWTGGNQGWEVLHATGGRFERPKPSSEWLPGFGRPAPGYMLTGDFNGDGLTDIAGWNPQIEGGRWHVAVTTGHGFIVGPDGFWIERFGSSRDGWMLTGDFNGDGKTDIAGWNRASEAWHVALSTGSRFDATPEGGGGFWIEDFGGPTPGRMLTGDFNGDGKSDLAYWDDKGRGHRWYVALARADGPGFVKQDRPWIERFGRGEPGFMQTGDFDGDGKADIAGWNAEHRAWHVALSTGTSFNPGPEGGAGFWIRDFGSDEQGETLTGDFDGDGKTDLLAWNRDELGWEVALSTGLSFDRNSPYEILRTIDEPDPGDVLVGNFAVFCQPR